MPSPLKWGLSDDDVATLEHLCDTHNDLQAQLVSAEKERQEAISEATHYKYGISQALGELSTIRRYLAECFEVALMATTAQERHPCDCHSFLQLDYCSLTWFTPDPGRSSSNTARLPLGCTVGADEVSTFYLMLSIDV